MERHFTGLVQGDSYPLSYEKFAEIYGKEVIEREAIPVQLATAEEVSRLMALIEGLKIDQEQQDKWFKKCNVDSYIEMSAEQINSLIQHCEKLILQLSVKK